MVSMDRAKRLPWLQMAVMGASVLLYACFSIGLPERYNSPDEAANAFFARRVGAGAPLAVSEPLNRVAQNPIVHPRSTLVIGDSIIPASFPGLALFTGTVSRSVGPAALPYVTPVIGAVLGLVALYLLVRELSGKTAANWALVLAALQPAVWYYHSRSFFHNALFLDFFLAAAYLAVRALRSRWWVDYLLLGLAAGAALAMRTSEIFWLAAAAAVFFLLQRRRVAWRYAWLTVAGALAAFAPVLAANQAMYGSPLSIGYRSGLSLAAADLTQAATLAGQLILPFGFHPRAMYENGLHYLVSLQWWWFALAALGIVFLAARWRALQPAEKAFGFTALVVAIWLVVLYGSWSFHDNPDPAAVTLGTSYARYWLPVYVLGLWPAGRALAWLTERRQRWYGYAACLAVGVYGVLSMQLVMAEPMEGLVSVRKNIMKFEAWSQEVLSLTEPSSVIVTGSTDKMFWPERAVIHDLVNPADYVSVRHLLEAGIPVYRFHPTWEPNDFALVNHRLAQYGLELAATQAGFQDFSLYQFRMPEP